MTGSTSALLLYRAVSCINCINGHLQHQRLSPSHIAPSHQPSFVTMDTDKLSGLLLLHLVRSSFRLPHGDFTLTFCIYFKRTIKSFFCFTGCLITSPGTSTVTTSQLILSGGEGYINFRIGKLK